MQEQTENWRKWSTSSPLWEELKPLAIEKRHEPTRAENKFWQQVRGRKLCGLKFRRQHPIERFIVDFFCSEVRLVVEIDGPIHDYTVEEDKIRQAFLESLALRVLRFTNEEVLLSTDAVLNKVLETAWLPFSEFGEGDGG